MNCKIINPLDGAISTEGRHLGDLVRWELTGHVRRDAVLAAAEAHDIEDALGFPRMTANSAYRHAVREAVRVGKTDERRYQIVKVEETASKIVHAIIEKSVGYSATGSALTNRDAAFSTETRIGFDKDAYFAGAKPDAMLQLEDPAHPIAVRVRERFEELLVTYRAEDIRVAFQRAFLAWAAAPIGNTGGLWWVPALHADRVRDWAAFMADIGCRAYIIPLFDTSETLASLRDITRESVEGQLAELMDEMTDFASRATTRTSTLEARVESFDSLRDRAELYERILGHRLDGLKAKLVAAEGALVASIAAISADPQDAADAAEEVL
jgi:hypothetical protein